MNEKNSLGLNLCFKDHNNPIKLFEEWFNKAKKTEINDPNAFAVGTLNKNGFPTVRMVLLKDFDKNGFVFYTNLNSDKSKAIRNTSKISMCFHWKSLQRQIRIVGVASKVSKKEADDYYNSRAYGSRIGAWASKQSSILKQRQDLYKSIEEFKKKYPNKNNIPRPEHWSGWRIKPKEIEFWLDGQNRIHERLKYIRLPKKWKKVLNGGWKDYGTCHGTQFILGISGRGDVFPCGHWFQERREEFLMGNLIEKSFKEIWQSDRYWEVQEKIRKEVYVNRDCESNCRQHYINRFLHHEGKDNLDAIKKHYKDHIKNKPDHINFI